MPPRKRKVVKKTVRKVVKKPTATTAETSPPSSPPPDTETATEAPVPVDTDTIPPAADTNASLEPSEPTADETLAPEVVPAETLIGEPAPAETLAEEAAVVETQAEKPASAESLDLEPASAPAVETLELEPASAEAPSASETAAALPATKTKTVLRVRKVLKKKIVKKLVPKPCSAAASSVAKEEVNEAQPEATPVEVIPSEQSDLEHPSADAALAPREEAVPEKAVIEPENGVDAGNEDNRAALTPREEAEPEKAVTDSEIGGDAGKEDNVEVAATGNEEDGLLERSKRRKTEIFIGGLDRDAKEEDLRKVFGKAGEIVEVRMIMDGQSGKNKGYAFLRYAEASQAKKAVADFEKVEVCGKICGASALKGNDTIFLGNIDKKWKKEDIIKLLQQAGIEKIETVTVMVDPNNADTSRGFAFLELESNKDAQIAYKKLQKKDALGKGRNIKVAWAEPFNDPDEEEMKKVKSVYAEGIPSSWDEEKVRETFKKFGEIERVVLARNIKSAKRKDFAFVNYTTRQAAMLCIESFDKESTDNNSQISLKVSLAKPAQKGKQNKGGSKSTDITEKARGGQRDTKANISSTKGLSFKRNHTDSGEKSSTSHEFQHVLREQSTWRQGQISYAGGPTMHDYAHGSGAKRHFSSMGDEALYSDFRGYPRARLDSSFTAGVSSYGAMPHNTVGSSFPYYQHQGAGPAGYGAGARYGATDYTGPHQPRQGAPPYGSSYYSRY